jgi:DNA repair exonuclease SbcCD nuclease subunit
VRLLHLSDLHLGYRQFQRQTPAGINQREADVAGSFRRAIDRAVELSPDLIVIAGDVFHNVRPTNPAILHAFRQFERLTRELPETLVVMVAGNHDLPRASETGCILSLFEGGNIHVVTNEARRLAFPERDLSILAVPDAPGPRPRLEPDAGAGRNVLLLHGEIEGVLPPRTITGDHASVEISREELGADRWDYVALGHYHVFREIAPNAYYSGSLDYTSANTWGEKLEEHAANLPGKGMIEYDLDAGRRTFHHLESSRALIDLEPITARGMSAADLDAVIRQRVEEVDGGIDDRIVRQLVRDVPRHIARELDPKAIREYKRRALHYHLDTRRPEIIRSSASGAPGRRPSLAETVRDKLRDRLLPSDVDRERLVELGLRYLREAEQAEATAAVTVEAT